MVPKYPFCVSTWRRIGAKLDVRIKSFETLAAASEYGKSIMRSPDVKRVQISCILDDRTRGEAGEVIMFDREAYR